MSALPPYPLLALQTWMQAAISMPGDAGLLARAASHLQSTPTLGATERLTIYRRSYQARLLQSFHAIFPGLLHVLGVEMLDAFALDFLQRSPPHNFSVNRVADGFVEYLQTTRPSSGNGATPDWSAFIIDLARLEIALLEVSDARGMEQSHGPVTEKISDMPDNQFRSSRPRTAPCLRLLDCAFPVHGFLQNVIANGAPAMPEPRPTFLALTRVQYRLSTRELAPVQWQLLRRLDGNTCLADALQAVVALNLRPVPNMELARLWVANFQAQGLLESVW